jgi:hypothetical protein
MFAICLQTKKFENKIVRKPYKIRKSLCKHFCKQYKVGIRANFFIYSIVNGGEIIMADVTVQKRGEVYQYKFEIAFIDGKRKYINKSGYATRQEALHEGALAYNEYYRMGKKKKQKDMSYSDYLDYWIANYCNFNLKYATIVTYLNIIKIYLKPRLGKYKLSQLDAQLIQDFINEIYLEKNLSKWYLKGILKLIKGSLKYAYYSANFINDNSAERVHIPRYETVSQDPAHIFTQEEIETILDRFKEVPYIYYSFLTAYLQD